MTGTQRYTLDRGNRYFTRPMSLDTVSPEELLRTVATDLVFAGRIYKGFEQVKIEVQVRDREISHLLTS